jgi:hypothetical protein
MLDRVTALPLATGRTPPRTGLRWPRILREYIYMRNNCPKLRRHFMKMTCRLGRPFMLSLDQKPLVSAISNSGALFGARQQRHLCFLSEFTTDFFHLSRTYDHCVLRTIHHQCSPGSVVRSGRESYTCVLLLWVLILVSSFPFLFHTL